MIHLTTINKEDILLEKNDILLIKSCGKDKVSIYVKGVPEPLIVLANFAQVQYAISSNLSEIAPSEPPVQLSQVIS